MATITVFETEIVLDPENKIHELIYSAKMDMDYIDYSLDQEARSLAKDMERVSDAISKGLQTNSLGEVQGRGGRIDVLCARRSAAADNMVKLLHVAGLR